MYDTLNGWMETYGYEWVEGKERLYKAQMDNVEATNLMETLRREGAIRIAG